MPTKELQVSRRGQQACERPCKGRQYSSADKSPRYGTGKVDMIVVCPNIVSGASLLRTGQAICQQVMDRLYVERFLDFCIGGDVKVEEYEEGDGQGQADVFGNCY